MHTPQHPHPWYPDLALFQWSDQKPASMLPLALGGFLSQRLRWTTSLGSAWTSGQAELSLASGPALASHSDCRDLEPHWLSPARSFQAEPAPPTIPPFFLLLLVSQTLAVSAVWGTLFALVSDYDPSWWELQRVGGTKAMSLRFISWVSPAWYLNLSRPTPLLHGV